MKKLIAILILSLSSSQLMPSAAKADAKAGAEMSVEAKAKTLAAWINENIKGKDIVNFYDWLTAYKTYRLQAQVRFILEQASNYSQKFDETKSAQKLAELLKAKYEALMPADKQEIYKTFIKELFKLTPNPYIQNEERIYLIDRVLNQIVYRTLDIMYNKAPKTHGGPASE